MEYLTGNVRDLEQSERRMPGHVLDRQLTENQQLVIGVVSVDLSESPKPVPAEATEVPAWWKVYQGLCEDQVDRLDQAIRQRANLSREFD